MTVLGVFWVPMALLQQTVSYVTTFVVQYFGANEKEKIGAAVWQSLYVSFFGGVGFLFLNYFSSTFFFMVSHPHSIQKLEVEYFNSIAFTALPTAFVAAISGFFTGIGLTKTVIWINFVGLILNVILDYIMIFGHFGFPALGIAGAGYATAISTLIAAFYGLYLLLKEENEVVYKLRSSFSPNLKLITQFLKYGIPSGLQWALEGLAFTSFLILMGKLPNGEVALVSSSIGVTVMMLSILPSMGIAQAVMMLVGQSLGEKNPKKAEMITWCGVRITTLYMTFVAITFFSFPNFYLSWFKNEENILLWSQILKTTPDILKVVALFTLFDSIYLNLSFALKGAGDTKFVSLLALTLPWPLMVLPALIFKNYNNALLISWLFVAVYSITITIFLLFRFRNGKWKDMSVIR